MLKTVIYFLRHGEVENPKKIIYGRLPGFNISENARQHIAQVAQELKRRNIGFLYVSPMRRTRQTAEILSQALHLKPQISRLLIETKLIHAGTSLDIFKKDIQPYIYDDKYVKLGQESISAQGERMMRFVRIMQKNHPGSKILAVSHGDPIVILKAKILGLPFSWEFKRSNYLKPGNYITLICEGKNYKWDNNQ